MNSPASALLTQINAARLTAGIFPTLASLP
jgi:hypothetical protein